MFHKRLRIYLLIIVLLLVFSWRSVGAEPPIIAYPAHQQLMSILPTLRDSEAEHVMGAYVPGVGVVISMDLIRGPNSVKNKEASVATRDWAIYLEQTFGAKLTSVPEQETIAFSVDYYDYANVVYHQLVVSSKATDIKSADKYQVYLDGKPFGGNSVPNPNSAAAPSPVASTQATTTNVTTPQVATTNVASGAATSPAAARATPKITGNSGPLKFSVDFADTQSIKDEWFSLQGKWINTGNAFEQGELGKFDLINYFTQPTIGDLTLQTNLKYLEGDMGGGLVFNAPTVLTKAGASMVSYTGKGSYMEWGYYDNGGNFQYQGGTAVPNGADGKEHTLAVKITGKNYQVSLDGTNLGQSVALNSPATGFTGLLASTSRVSFNNFKIEGTHQ